MNTNNKCSDEALSEPLQQCNVRRSSSINVAQNIFDKYFISTAMWAKKYKE